MKDFAKTEMGENGENFRRPQTGLPWFAQRFGESAAVSRYGEIAFTEFAVRRHEREDNFTLLGQRCSKAKEVLHRVATEVLRNPQQRAEGTGLVRETMSRVLRNLACAPWGPRPECRKRSGSQRRSLPASSRR